MAFASASPPSMAISSISMRSNGNGRASAEQLGVALRKRRKALGLTQEQLCELAGVGPAFLYELEQGKATVRLDKLLDVLAVLGLELSLQAGSKVLSIAPELRDG
jgi:HTH-type transcriptional regulator / antitoxin HipB